MKDREDLFAPHRAMANLFSQPNPENLGVYKMLDELYPAFKEKIFQGNQFMRNLVLSGYSPLHILDYPICGKCETIAVLDGYAEKDGYLYDACSCFAEGCGHRTINPVTFRVWMIEELKRKAPPDIVEAAEYAVDFVAERMLRIAGRDLQEILEKHQAVARAKLNTPNVGEKVTQEEATFKFSEDKNDDEIERILEEADGGI